MLDDLKIRALIVDDLPTARQKVRTLLERHTDVEIIGDCANGYDAIAAINDYVPELVFLDVRMPEIDGFAVLDQIREEIRPLVIFVTHYKEYAVQGHNVEAVHYLLKPLARKRFDEALQRARARLAKARESKRQDELLLINPKPGHYLVINKNNIGWVKATGKYVEIHIGRESHLHRMPISALQAQLHLNKFVRIHRKYIVNIYYIKELQRLSKQKYQVLLKDEAKLSVSDSGYKKLEARGIAPSRSNKPALAT